MQYWSTAVQNKKYEILGALNVSENQHKVWHRGCLVGRCGMNLDGRIPTGAPVTFLFIFGIQKTSRDEQLVIGEPIFL